MLIFSIVGIICIVVWVATWIYAIVDMFKRKDMKGWHIAAWMAAIIIFPLVGLIAYILFRPPAGQIEYKDETIA
jgi:hypothetical protein